MRTNIRRKHRDRNKARLRRIKHRLNHEMKHSKHRLCGRGKLLCCNPEHWTWDDWNLDHYRERDWTLGVRGNNYGHCPQLFRAAGTLPRDADALKEHFLEQALIVQDVAAYKALGILAFGGNPQFEEYKETVLAMHPTMTGK